MICGVGHRRGSDPTLLWLWCRPAAAALIRPLAWEPLYATGAALKKRGRGEQGKQGNEKNIKFRIAVLSKWTEVNETRGSVF